MAEEAGEWRGWRMEDGEREAGNAMDEAMEMAMAEAGKSESAVRQD